MRVFRVSRLSPWFQLGSHSSPYACCACADAPALTRAPRRRPWRPLAPSPCCQPRRYGCGAAPEIAARSATRASGGAPRARQPQQLRYCAGCCGLWLRLRTDSVGRLSQRNRAARPPQPLPPPAPPPACVAPCPPRVITRFQLSKSVPSRPVEPRGRVAFSPRRSSERQNCGCQVRAPAQLPPPARSAAAPAWPAAALWRLPRRLRSGALPPLRLALRRAGSARRAAAGCSAARHTVAPAVSLTARRPLGVQP
jgi:hypothetical protein